MANPSSDPLRLESQDLLPSEHHDPNHQHPECRYPKWPKGFVDSKYYDDAIEIGSWIVWILLAFTTASLCIAIFLMARGFTSDEPTTYSPDSSKFPLYKNSAFENCSSVRVKPTDCETLKKLLGDARPRNVLATPSYKMGRPQKVLDWCTAMQCFKGYKVIPSQPYPSARIPNNFSVWVSFNIAMLSLLWFLRRYLQSAQKSQGGRETPRGGCAGLGSLKPLDWCFIIFDFAGAFLWWWISFFMSVADSRQWSSMSFAAWTVTWRHVFDLQYHPYSCALAKYPRWSRHIKRLLQGLVLAQWCATIYAINIWMGWRFIYIVPPGYQCLPDEIANAPGTSTCSSAKLCSQDWMFKSYYPGINYGDSSGPKLFLWHTCGWTLLVMMITIRSSGLSDKEARAEKDKPAFWYIIMVFILAAAVVSVYFDVDVALDFFRRRDVVNRYAPVAFSEECTAVHVALSPWKHYFDVDKKWSSVWIAKAWLDA